MSISSEPEHSLTHVLIESMKNHASCSSSTSSPFLSSPYTYRSTHYLVRILVCVTKLTSPGAHSENTGFASRVLACLIHPIQLYVVLKSDAATVEMCCASWILCPPPLLALLLIHHLLLCHCWCIHASLAASHCGWNIASSMNRF